MNYVTILTGFCCGAVLTKKKKKKDYFYKTSSKKAESHRNCVKIGLNKYIAVIYFFKSFFFSSLQVPAAWNHLMSPLEHLELEGVSINFTVMVGGELIKVRKESVNQWEVDRRH